MPRLSEDEGAAAAPGATRRDVIGALVIVGATVALAFGPRVVARLSAHPSAAECDALLVRYVEMKERAVSDKIDPARQQAELDAARRAAGPSFASCTSELTRDEAECARGANNADEFERCLR